MARTVGLSSKTARSFAAHPGSLIFRSLTLPERSAQASSPGGGCAWLEDPHGVGIEGAPAHFLGDPPRRLVVRLPSEREGSPVDSHELGRAQVDPRLEPFLRWGGGRGGGGAWRVGAGGKRG